MTDEEEAIFLSGRAATDRSAFAKFCESENASNIDTEIDAARQRFVAAPLLHHPRLQEIAHCTLKEIRGGLVDEHSRFPATLWLHGAEKTYDGRDFTGTIAQFVKLLEDRSRALAAKRSGWIIEPTTNTDGWRGNASTVAMHALFLDCDGTGTWDELLGILTALDYCFVAYQSGGWSPTTPKWRIVLPLHAPHDTRTEQGHNTWRSLYTSARVLFGSAARLLNVGFDPATDTPCCPWFLTEKRDVHDTPRQIVWRAGHSLDLTALAIALPEIVEERAAQHSYAENTTASAIELDEDRMNHIIDVLSTATARVPSGRRDLYLALPGVMLDRGVCPDDVLAIVEAVSSNYPRKHADKHADNMHNARTTISRWLAKTHYTRIGVLNSAAPAVAAALDVVLPDPAAKAIVDAMEQLLADSPTSPANAQAQISPSSPSSPPVRRLKLSNFGRGISPIAARLHASSKPLNRLSGLLLGCFLKGIPLPTTAATTPAEVDEMVAIAMRTIGRFMPVTSRWQEALDFASRSLSLMNFTQSVERVTVAERAFYEGQGKRHKANSVKEAKASEFRSQSQSFFAQTKVKG